MGFLTTFALVVFLSLALLFGAVQARAESPTKKKAKGIFSRIRGWFKDKPYSSETDNSKESFSRADLKQRLADLSASEKPTDLAMGAMCYKMAMPHGTVDVMCTHCQKKTVVKKDWNTKRLDDCLRMVQAINKAKRQLKTKLDNRFYCAHCNPDIKEKTEKHEDGSIKLPPIKRHGCDHVDSESIDGLYLIIDYRGEKTSRRVSINHEGLKVLTAFVQGKDRTKGMTGSETALKERADILKNILGIE